MRKIAANTTREELAAIVVKKLTEHQIDAVLVGGSVVSIYTNNKYESRDLDFISPADHKKITQAMSELGFESAGKDFVHPSTSFTVEFPTGPLAIGDDLPVQAEGHMKVSGVTIKMFSPTQSVMDRLTWFYFSNDRQCLDQAIWIAQKHPIDIEKVKQWSARERQEEKLQVFLNRIK
jgi:hypothetical protein